MLTPSLAYTALRKDPTRVDWFVYLLRACAVKFILGVNREGVCYTNGDEA